MRVASDATDDAANIVGGKVEHIDAVEQHRAPILGIEEPEQHGGQCRLSGAGHAGDCDVFTGSQAEIEVVKNARPRPPSTEPTA